MKSGDTHKFLFFSAQRLVRGCGRELMHTIIAASEGALDETFGRDVKNFIGPTSEGLWLADFQYSEDEHGYWRATQVSEWVRLNEQQAVALANGKPFAEVVAS